MLASTSSWTLVAAQAGRRASCWAWATRALSAAVRGPVTTLVFSGFWKDPPFSEAKAAFFACSADSDGVQQKPQALRPV